MSGTPKWKVGFDGVLKGFLPLPFHPFLRHPRMGNNESNDHRPLCSSDSKMSLQNISRLVHSDNSTKLHVEAPVFHPKLVRSDTTVAQAGSPPRSLLDDEQPLTKGDPNTSVDSSANSSFPLSESALPPSFDTSGDLTPAQLSHFFPLPPTTNDAHGSFAASNSASSASLHKTSRFSLNGKKEKQSLQETLDALWAPPKLVPVRISAPVSPISTNDEPLIDLSCEPMPTMPSLLSCSADTSFENKSSGSFPSANQSAEASGLNMKTNGDESAYGGQLVREETLTQLLASHPELDLGPLDNSVKEVHPDPTNSISHRNGTVSVLFAGADAIQFPPVTYADATDVRSFSSSSFSFTNQCEYRSPPNTPNSPPKCSKSPLRPQSKLISCSSPSPRTSITLPRTRATRR
ncbi:hypothetical protein C8F04DRAFT_590796 [Mycena alexandri]|uniref:Uncharacterized protein n=1 Tax=Mycena alexandri TaxID=1745969 RepID=A0AAD6X9X1_9AGAR|nr:hypothetical protein C8F04DRAFT_590796 [Mycena alexandri]